MRPDPESNKYKRNTLTGYTVVYVPESFLRARRLMAREGYANSSKDHQFCADETGTTLQSRRKWCPCTPCLTSPTLCADVPYAANGPSKCLLQHIVGEATTRHPQQQAAAVNASARKRDAPGRISMHDDDATVASHLLDKQHVLIRINQADRRTAALVGEAYFVAVDMRKPPWCVRHDGMFGGGQFQNLYEKGTWVCRIMWMQMVQLDEKTGTRFYLPLAGSLQTISVSSIVRTGLRQQFKMSKLRNGRYAITDDLHSQVMKYSRDLSEVQPNETEFVLPQKDALQGWTVETIRAAAAGAQLVKTCNSDLRLMCETLKVDKRGTKSVLVGRICSHLSCDAAESGGASKRGRR